MTELCISSFGIFIVLTNKVRGEYLRGLNRHKGNQPRLPWGIRYKVSLELKIKNYIESNVRR